MAADAPRSPLSQLILARLREFFREPAAVFWVYGFPLLLALALGFAFQNRPVERITVDIQATETADDPRVAELIESLEEDERLEVAVFPKAEARERLQRGNTDLVVVLQPDTDDGRPAYEYWVEPNRPESVLARNAVDSVLLRANSPDTATEISEQTIETRGSRYIDFLIPGLIGMNLMGGGLWGVGFVTVDMRVRKLLKRYLATPMRRHDFLLSLMTSRLIFMVPEVLVLLLFGYWIFDVGIAGNILELIALMILGGAAFAGLGLLVACRAKTLETVSGLMNLVMLPMWVLSGVFFSSERFPESAQPVIQALPLTALNDGLRGIMLDGKGLVELSNELLILLAWGVVSFAIALRYFRWR